MKQLLRLGAVGFLLVACTSSEDEARGCKNVDTNANSCVVGAEVADDHLALDAVARVAADGRSKDAADFEVTSDRPDVVSIVAAEGKAAPCDELEVPVKALAEGTATLTFTLSDGTKLTRKVIVEAPDRLEIAPFLDGLAGAFRTRDGDTMPAPKKNEMVQSEGGTMLWEVTYLAKSNTRLRGNRANTYLVPEGASSVVVESTSDRELFEMTTKSAVKGKIEVRSGILRSEVPLEVVPPSAVTSVRLFVEDDAKAAAPSDGPTERRHVLARAYDANARAIYGIPFVLSLEGNPLPLGGEVLAYDIDPNAAPRNLVATVSGTSAKAEAVLKIAASSQSTRSSGRDYANCSFGSGPEGASSFFLGAAAVTIVLARRRRRAEG